MLTEDGPHRGRLEVCGEQRAHEGALLALGAPARGRVAERLVAREDQRQIGRAEAREKLDNLREAPDGATETHKSNNYLIYSLLFVLYIPRCTQLLTGPFHKYTSYR